MLSPDLQSAKQGLILQEKPKLGPSTGAGIILLLIAIKTDDGGSAGTQISVLSLGVAPVLREIVNSTPT